jgi:hypothetical protein
MASPPLGETILLFPEAELEPVALPSPSLEGSCCAIAPASGNANKLAASSTEREIETIATFLSKLAACSYAATFIKRVGLQPVVLFRNAAHADSTCLVVRMGLAAGVTDMRKGFDGLGRASPLPQIQYFQSEWVHDGGRVYLDTWIR